MEHLQRQQEAKLEMNMHDKHLLHAQLLFAQHAAAARASGSRLDSALSDKVDGQTYPAAPPASNSHLGRVDPFGEGKDLQEDEQEMMDPEEHNEGEEEDEENDDDDDDDEEEENGCQQHVKKPRLQHVAGFSLPTYPTSQVSAVQQMADSPPSATKEESSHSAVCKYSLMLLSVGLQRGSAIWAEETDGGKVRGEPSRDFAKLYELDSDPKRKEFLDELFVFMQKRGEIQKSGFTNLCLLNR
uniref:AT-rich interaction domain 3B n=1 Tax=Mola mola TaxID=94237 RepID=A0A3Q3WUE9_MOLML